MLMLFIPTVLADVFVGVGVDSDGGDIEGNFELESDGGDITVLIEGVNYEDELEELDASTMKRGDGFDMYSLYSRIISSFMEYKYHVKTWFVKDYDDLLDHEKKLRFVFDNYFVPRSELLDLHDMYQSQINQLHLEIKTLQKVSGFTDEEICAGRITLAEEIEIDEVTCGTTIYKYTPLTGWIGITEVKQPDPSVRVVEYNLTEPNTEILNTTLEVMEDTIELLLNDVVCTTNMDCPEFSGMTCVIPAPGEMGTCIISN